MIVKSIDSEIRFFGASETQITNGFFDRKHTGQTPSIQKIHKLTKHTSKISSSSRFIHKTFIQVYRYVTHQHSVFVLRERRRAPFFYDRETYFMT